MMTRVNGTVQLVGASRAMATLRAQIEEVAPSDSKVLVTGESGSGKEVVAREIHAGSRRARRALVVVNCAGLPEALLESELFGHVRGSFSGAYRDKPGKLELAHEGTVFLDEIGDMSPRMQALLLRFVETGEIQKVGSDDDAKRIEVRIVAATNRNVHDLVAEGGLRQDLFYRLNVVHLEVPPLRERREDIAALVTYFLGQLRRANGTSARAITPEAIGVLQAYSWPGNVRELQNTVERTLMRSHDDVIAATDLPPEILAISHGDKRPLRDRRRTIVDDLFARMVKDQQSFWSVVYPVYMRRDLTRDGLRDLVERGLHDAHGNYRVVANLFNINPNQYKKFLNFLRKQECQPPYRRFR
jgi:transcriptional regulator with PAS, ATPase and Fis domain